MGLRPQQQPLTLPLSGPCTNNFLSHNPRLFSRVEDLQFHGVGTVVYKSDMLDRIIPAKSRWAFGTCTVPYYAFITKNPNSQPWGPSFDVPNLNDLLKLIHVVCQSSHVAVRYGGIEICFD